MTNPEHDNIDQRLRAAASRWQLPPELDKLSLSDVQPHRGKSPTHRRLSIAAVAATVAAITATAVLLGHNQHNNNAATAGSNPAATSHTNTSEPAIAAAAKSSAPLAAASGSATKVTDYRGLPQNAGTLAASKKDAGYISGISAAWTRDHQLAIVLVGSGDCYPTVTSLIEISPQQLQVGHSLAAGAPSQISSANPEERPSCTLDLSPHTTVWTVPAGLDVHKPVVLVLHDELYPDDTVTLPGL